MHRISSTIFAALATTACPLCPLRRLNSVVVSKLSYPSLSGVVHSTRAEFISIATSKKARYLLWHLAFAVKDGCMVTECHAFDSNNYLLPARIKQEFDTVLRSIWGATWRNRCNPIWRMETDRKRQKYYQTRLGARTNMEKSLCEGFFFLGCVFRFNTV
ncbi:hypothetical protein CY34DRAFT_169761 [Suillus luteus UH-Slu-Lm8-n1]|uniref:Secreted protein n=1 Tax=Suillus luteus UH-Slu-Lm8-n1 TaxID=930992 RepID=A0A0D0AC52_9AGAM|nr:hypothetical protein CY34DRAFT_169761 [Suillus luteus UH-Slu-Lm8-n1]